MTLTGNAVLYPLAVGNRWVYRMKDGNTYTNSVTGANGPDFMLHSSMMNTTSTMRKGGETYYTDAYEAGNLQVTLKDNLSAGDQWEIRFTANGILSIMTMRVKQVGATVNAAGREFAGVTIIEAESKFSMGGNIIPTNFFTTYHYAASVGLVLTTTSQGDEHALIEYQA